MSLFAEYSRVPRLHPPWMQGICLVFVHIPVWNGQVPNVPNVNCIYSLDILWEKISIPSMERDRGLKRTAIFALCFNAKS